MAEDSFDRLLRRTLQRDTPGAGCPEPSVLASFADGLLRPAERSAIEAHAASCARCSAELALIAAAAPAGPPPSVAPQRGFRLHWRWAVPLVTAVLVFVVWTETDRPEQVEQLRQKSSAPAAPPAGAPPPSAIARSEDVHDLAAPDLQKSDARSREPKKEAGPPPAAAARSEPSAFRQQAESARRAPAADAGSPEGPAFRDEVSRPAEGQYQVTQDAPPRPPAAPEPLRSEAAADSRLAEATQEEREAASRGARVGEADRKDASPVSGTPQQPAAPAAEAAPAEAPKRLQRDSGTGNLAATGLSRSLVISASSNPDVRVRIDAAGIERTVDGGGTWTLERSLPAHTVLTGVCPSVETCWLAGERGLVLRREAGGRWLDVSLGVAVGVSRVDAADAAQATTTLVDGRRFSTADSGRTWTPIP